MKFLGGGRGGGGWNILKNDNPVGRLFGTREYMISKFTEKSKQVLTKILSL